MPAAKPAPWRCPELFGETPQSLRAASAPRLPSKEARLCQLLCGKPLTLSELRACPLVRRKIGPGYLDSMLKSLLDEGKISVTDGVFWARPPGESKMHGPRSATRAARKARQS
jgi:hypothetical protein